MPQTGRSAEEEREKCENCVKDANAKVLLEKDQVKVVWRKYKENC